MIVCIDFLLGQDIANSDGCSLSLMTRCCERHFTNSTFNMDFLIKCERVSWWHIGRCLHLTLHWL